MTDDDRPGELGPTKTSDDGGAGNGAPIGVLPATTVDGTRVIEEHSVDVPEALGSLSDKIFKRERVLGELVKDEVVRAGIAVLLLVLLAVIIVFAFTRTKTWAETKEMLDVVLPTVSALLGSAVGFYFGTKRD